MNSLPLHPILKHNSLQTELNSHHNALRQITVVSSGYTFQGFAISGLSSYIQVHELDLCFDMGECPLSALPLNHVFLTHAHGDHSRCLMRHDSLRKMIGIARPATYYIPEAIYEGACNWIRSEAMFEGVSEARFVLPKLIAVPTSQWMPLAYRPDLIFQGFPVRHSTPSLGYTVAISKRKLRDEFIGLPQAKIIELRMSGVDITREVVEPKVTYIADCIGESLLEQAHIWQSETLIIECTFLEDDEQAMARKKGHSHVQDVIRALEAMENEMKCKLVILKHFSMKYGRKQILGILERKIPARFHDRILALI